jgi:hypothetical protein
MEHTSKSSALQLGLIVLGALAVLTAIEFAIALTVNICSHSGDKSRVGVLLLHAHL